MKLRRLPIALFAFLALTLAACLSPGFSRFWAEHVSRPVLRALSLAAMRLPFSLLEWGIVALAAPLAASVCRRWMRRGPRCALGLLARRLCDFALAAALAFSGLWLPLYHAAAESVYAATEDQLAASCESLIGALNASALNFSNLPDDLPAKRAAFPFWMRALGITGFFSFPTGEALISPELPDSAVPFVAIHEHMHSQGYAGEGAANIAAWESCLDRGETYADSARLWALKYSMELLYDRNPRAYTRCRRQMNEATFAAFREIGGGRRAQPQGRGMRAAFAALGVHEASRDYEMLATYLASRMPL